MAELGVDEQCRTLVSTPLYSNTTLFMFLSTMANGGTAFIMEKFDTQRFLKLSEVEKITHAVLVPVQYERLLNDPAFDRFDLSSYQLKISTSAPLHKQTKEALLERWPAGGLLEIYGMTEGGVGCFLMAHERPDKLDTVGQPGPGCDLKILGDQGDILPLGEVGEIIGRSDNMMQGYVNRDEATKEASWFDKAGRRYHKSGDIGWLDEEGFLHLLDRKKDMIISGGFNVYAIDLERVVLGHAAVEDCAVVAGPSQQWGETPVAFVTVSSKSIEGNIEPEKLCEWANKQLGKAQRISEIRIIDSLPRSPIGKVLKRELRDLL
jgi:acyl-CoA synthetase (AMP-forming)/AMP-acid ligase II